MDGGTYVWVWSILAEIFADPVYLVLGGVAGLLVPSSLLIRGPRHRQQFSGASLRRPRRIQLRARSAGLGLLQRFARVSALRPEVESLFIDKALSCEVVGMNNDLMDEYIELVAGRLSLSSSCSASPCTCSSRFTGGTPTPVGVGTPQANLKLHVP